MPPALELRLEAVGDGVVVSYGGRALAWYERGDRGMRNLAIVSLTSAGVAGVEVARLFGVRPEHVSRLRRQALEGGSAGLLPPMGRPVKLDQAAVKRAYEMSDRGVAGCEIAATLRVSAATISRLLARRPVREVDRLPLADTSGSAETGDGSDTSAVMEVVEAGDSAETGGCSDANHDGSDTSAVMEVVGAADSAEMGGGAETGDGSDTSAVMAAVGAGERIDRSDLGDTSDGVGGGEDRQPASRIGEGGGRSVYAGAMLLHSFLEKVGAGEVLSVLDSGPARRYDTTAVALAGTFAFALGSCSLEGSKHLLLADAGLLVGAERFPHLRTLRPRLGALADAVDPLAVQLALSKAMLDADPQPPSVFFVDEHFVAYTGSRPVAKGWNSRRRHAEPGRHETVLVDDRWRAVCFSSGPPQGLATGMLGPLDQLREICGERPLMIGFDRGGSYPKVFSELRDRGLDWVSYRRAPLVAATVKPRSSWVAIDARRHYLRVADELVELQGYGRARQITLYEHGRVALQILTSDRSTPAARLAHVLRCRWCIENTFKYLEDHHGLHWLSWNSPDFAES